MAILPLLALLYLTGTKMYEDYQFSNTLSKVEVLEEMNRNVENVNILSQNSSEAEEDVAVVSETMTHASESIAETTEALNEVAGDMEKFIGKMDQIKELSSTNSSNVAGVTQTSDRVKTLANELMTELSQFKT